MVPVKVVALITLIYLALLFAMAHYGDRRQKAGKSIISNPYIYTLSLTVYLTSWTFYGNVGRAAKVGLDFLPIYLGPSLIAFTWWFLLRKIVRISKEQNIVTIADFISSRYGKSESLGALVTVFAVIGTMPYIALELRAVSHTFDLLSTPLFGSSTAAEELLPFISQLFDTAFIVALALGIFGILFGARQLNSSERHEGMVAAIALESLIKLIAFLAVGFFVTYNLFGGFGDIFVRFLAEFPERNQLLLLGTEKIPYAKWFSLTFMSAMACMFLPRMFHVLVIENSAENHIKSAMWLFPTYMFLISLFIIPVALGGLLLNAGYTFNADNFAIYLPLLTSHPWLAMLVFLGGFSASAGMVIVSSVAISSMILNNLAMPIILRLKPAKSSISGGLISLKRAGIFAVIFLGYLYYRIIGEAVSLVDTGFISFAAITQFAPALIGGLYWKRANRNGAIVGLISGFFVWFFTLVVPTLVSSGWLDDKILEKGLLGYSFLRPTQLFGLTDLDIWSHSLFWTLFFNLGLFLVTSLLTTSDATERDQALKFVNVFEPNKESIPPKRLKKAPEIVEFVELMAKFIGQKQAYIAISQYLGDREIDIQGRLPESDIPILKQFTEKTLAGSVGSAPARIIVENYLTAKGSEMEDVFDIFGRVTISRKTGREQLGILYETTRIVASGADLQSILDNILELFREQFMLDLCVIRIVDERKDMLTVRSQKGMSSEHLGDSNRGLNLDSYAGEAFLTNSVQVNNDTDFLTKPISAQVIHQEGIKSFAHTPITIDGKPIGVLSAFSKSEKGIFTEEFIDLYKNLAGQVGVAWRNATQTEKLIAASQHEHEMQIARSIQLGLLPGQSPKIKGVSLSGYCVPAMEIGGDYYDYLLRGSKALDLVIADVSGHNLGAALIMGWVRTFIQAEARKLETASEIMRALNEFFYEDLTRAELFITMFYLIYDTDAQEITFSNAGHSPPLLWRKKTGAVEKLDTDGLILGIMSEVTFEQKKERLFPGDVLLLYTDGITEAEDRNGEFFGEDRLCQFLSENYEQPPETIIKNLLERVYLFTNENNFKDDVTLVVMRRKEEN